MTAPGVLCVCATRPIITLSEGLSRHYANSMHDTTVRAAPGHPELLRSRPISLCRRGAAVANRTAGHSRSTAHRYTRANSAAGANADPGADTD